VKTLRWIPAGVWRLPEGGLCKSYTVSLARSSNIRNPDLYPDLTADQEKGTSQLGCVSVAAGATLIVRCRSYNFQFFLQM
jgi:hypothetical protein